MAIWGGAFKGLSQFACGLLQFVAKVGYLLIVPSTSLALSIIVLTGSHRTSLAAFVDSKANVLWYIVSAEMQFYQKKTDFLNRYTYRKVTPAKRGQNCDFYFHKGLLILFLQKWILKFFCSRSSVGEEMHLSMFVRWYCNYYQTKSLPRNIVILFFLF